MMASTSNTGVPGLLKRTTLPAGLVEADIIKLADETVTFLQSTDEYGNDDVLQTLKAMGQVYWKYTSLRQKFADRLGEQGFAEIAHAMLKHFNNIGVFKNDAVWFPTYYTMNNSWNFSDVSLILSKKMVDAGFVTMLLANISHQPYLDNQNSKNVTYILKASLSILQNIAKAPGSPVVYRQQNAPDLLRPFTTSENEFFKAVSMMCLTNIVSEDENAHLEDTGTINFMVNSIAKAIQNPKRRHRGFSPTELAECLGRMAVNDQNKIKVVDGGALPLFVKMMIHSDEEEQFAAAKAIWTLAFDKNVKEKIKEEPKCVSSLEKLAESENGKVRRAAKGAIWIIKDSASQDKLQREKTIVEAGGTKDHVFISYQWANQPIIVQLANKLKADGFRVWVDVEQMGGSTLEAMALAVENAALVLIGMSEKYKISPNCRTEAEYTFKRQKAFVPLMMQRGYQPDGWLGMLLGTKLYINFDGKYEFDHAYQMLLREVKDRGRATTDKSHDQIDGPVSEKPIQAKTVQPLGATIPFSQSTQPAQPKVASWKKEDIKKWLKENKLDRLTGLFEEYDGKAMNQLCRMKFEAPEFFYSALDKKFELNMLDILLFAAAMESLPK